LVKGTEQYTQMDPFSAIGLAGNIVQFVDFGCKLFSQTREIYSSATGASRQIDDADTIARVLHDLSMRLVPTASSRYVAKTIRVRFVYGRAGQARSRLSRDGPEVDESGRETPIAVARVKMGKLLQCTDDGREVEPDNASKGSIGRLQR